MSRADDTLKRLDAFNARLRRSPGRALSADSASLLGSRLLELAGSLEEAAASMRALHGDSAEYQTALFVSKRIRFEVHQTLSLMSM